MGTAPGYSWNKIVSETTLENVVVANPNSVTDDVIAVNLSCNTGAIVKNARVLSGGQILNRDYNGYTENIHVSNGGTLILRSANASAKDAYISSGGLGYCQLGATYTNVEIFNGGTFYQNRGTVNNMIVHAGGVIGGWNSPAGTVWNNLTVEDGASFTTYAGFTMMGNVNIAAGAWTNAAAAHTVDGALTDVTLAVNATFSTGVALKNVTWNGGNVNFFNVAVSGYTQNTNQGVVRSAGASVEDADVKTGTLYVQDGAVGSNIRVSNGAGLQVTNMAAGATLKDITVYAGGTLANSVKTVYENVTIQDGGHWTLGASYDISGDIDFVAGGLTNDADAHAVDGTIYDLDFGLTGAFGQGITLSNFNQTAGAVTLKNGASIKTGTMAAGAYLLYMGGNGSISDFTLKGSAGAAAGTLGTLHVSNGGVLSNVTVETGAQLNVSTGAYCYGLTLDGGIAAVRTETGYASGVTVNDGGTFYIQANGSAENVHVYTGGSMQFHSGKVNGLVVEAGGVVNRGWAGANGSRTWENIDVKEGASMTLDNYFTLKGDVNIAQGALTNDADAYAENGTIYDFDHAYTAGTFASGVTLSGFTQTAGTVDIAADAAIKTATLTDGTLNLNAGATAENVTQNAGTLNVNADATLDTATLAGGAVNIASGATVRDLVQNAGTVTITAGADVDGFTYNGGTFAGVAANATVKNFYKVAAGNLNVYTSATVDGGVLYAGQLQALSNTSATSSATIKNYTVSGGALVVRGTTNVAENITVSGGAIHVQNAVARNVEILDGASIQCTNGAYAGYTVSGLTIRAGGSGNMTTTGGNFYDLTLDAGAKLTMNNAKIGGATVSGGELAITGNSNCISGGATGATIDNLTVTGTGQLWINDPYSTSGGAAYDPIRTSNMTVGAGLFVMMHGTNVTASNATVLGSMYVQNGATLTGGEIRAGGYLNSWKRGGYNDNTARGRIVGVTVRSGGSADGTDADFVNMTVEAGGKLSLNPGAAIGGTENSIAQGALYLSGTLVADAHTDENHVLCDLDISAQALSVNSGIALANLNIGNAGRIIATDATITNFDVEAPDQTVVGRLYLSSGTVASGGRLNGNGTVNAIYMTDGAKLNEMHVSNGGIFMSADAEMTNLEMTGGIVILRGEQTYISGATISEGALHIQNGGDGDSIVVAGGGLNASDTTFTNPSGKTEVINNVVMTAGSVRIGAGATVNKLTATGGTVFVTSGGTINVQSGGALNDLQTEAGAKINFVENKAVATFTGENTNIAEGTLYFSDTAVAGHAANGVLEGFNADNSTVGYKLSIGSGIVLKDAVGNNTAVRVSAFDGAVVSGMTLRGGAIICANNNNVRILDTTLTGEAGAGQTCNLNLSAGAYASNTTVGSGAKIQFQHADAKADNTTIMAGGSMVMTAAADTGDLVTLDFTGTGGDQSVNITNFANVSGDTKIVFSGWTAGNTYTLTTGSATDKTVHCYDWGLYDDAVAGGATYTNPFDGFNYDFTNGKAIVVSSFEVAAKSTAGTITTSDTALNTNDRAAKWDSDTQFSGNVTLADGNLDGNVWLQIDGTTVMGVIYGATKEFDGEVNIHVQNGQIKNLAAGSRDGDGTVAGVKLTLSTAHMESTAYAAGFGSVDGAAETLIEGGTFARDFYAGALDNYANGSGVKGSQVGEVSLTVTGGDFAGNLYGASSVKVGSYTGDELVHSVANGVNITISGGETTKKDFCCFAGGYANGSNSDALVYRVNGGVTATISGGSWGEARGGRGIFGGVFASGVQAEVDDVDITISGGTMGNVYGGGWAQKGGTSVVGDVNISIAGGTVTNVFGGGSHSKDGNQGTTSVGDVTITVSGGDIKGDIYARGQSNGDLAASAKVVFTGAEDFGCGVYGYSYVGGGDSDANLSYTDYTGEFYGEIGGFEGITFDGNTAMKFSSPAEVISNGDWKFDLADRDAALAGTSLLSWSYAGFAGDTVKVNFADEAQAKAGWSIAAASFTGATFTLAIDSLDIGSAAYGEAIAGTGTAYDGWGFTLENDVLKFKNLA